MRKSPPFTYGKLDRFLKKLGFERLIGDGYFVYKHENGAMIALPDLGNTVAVLPAHALAVRKTLEWNGFEEVVHEVPV